MVSTTALVFACHEKACAPPPVGKGGTLSTRKYGLKIDESFFPKMSRYTETAIEVVDARSLVATQEWLHSKPSMAKITPPGWSKAPNVYEDPETGLKYIGDGHHRIAAHAAANRPVRVKVWRIPK